MRVTMTMCLWLAMCAPVPAQPATQPAGGDFALGEREKIVFVGETWGRYQSCSALDLLRREKDFTDCPFYPLRQA